MKKQLEEISQLNQQNERRKFYKQISEQYEERLPVKNEWV